jgi:cation diffusion facilitator CzcD-associated flavoprotein CzcO
MGHFAQPLLPNYPGIENFRGHLRHSSNWDPNFDPAGKRVARIGNGALGLHILPHPPTIAESGVPSRPLCSQSNLDCRII